MELGRELSAILGRRVRKQIRKTEETPPRVSIIDVAVVITGTNANHAGQILRRIKDRYPDVHSFCVDFRFPGQGQKDTPVAGIRGLVEIIMLLPGEGAARVRRQAAELLCRRGGLRGGLSPGWDCCGFFLNPQVARRRPFLDRRGVSCAGPSRTTPRSCSRAPRPRLWRGSRNGRRCRRGGRLRATRRAPATLPHRKAHREAHGEAHGDAHRAH